MSESRLIEVTMDDSTLAKLLETGQSLTVYKGVNAQFFSGSGQCISTVFYSTGNLAKSMEVVWEQPCYAYVSREEAGSKPIPGTIIDASNWIPADLGETVSVQSDGSLKVVPQGGEPSYAVSILNSAPRNWICGINQKVNNLLSPLVACSLFQNCQVPLTPLFSTSDASVAPYDQLLLVFEPVQAVVGTVVQETQNSSIFVISQGEPVTVEYNFDTGWNLDSFFPTRVYPDKIESINDLFNNPQIAPSS